MAKVFIEETTLTAIGDAIRGKEGTTELVPVNDMATRISSIQTGSDPVIESLEITSNGTYTATDCDGYSPITVNVPQDGAPTDEELVVTGDCQYRFGQDGWNWLIDKYGNRITTKNITNCLGMFYSSGELKSIPFDINMNNKSSLSRMFYGCENLTHIPDLVVNHSSYASCDSLFSYCSKLEELPKITGLYPDTIGDLFNRCFRLRYIPEDYFDTWNFSRLNSYNYADISGIFIYCHSLRKVPEKIFTYLNPPSTSSSYSMYGDMVDSCHSLDGVTNITVVPATLTSNVFSNTVRYCYRLKNFTFATNEDGTPKTANWKSQTIDLTTVGSERLAGTNIHHIVTKPAEYAQGYSKICKYNSGISSNKVIVDDVTYQALKNDPDSFVCSDNDTLDGASPYSRYNLESATRTINSLPDTSAYGRNTIKFRNGAGTATDGGGITAETMTELSALADSKGWTVALV